MKTPLEERLENQAQSIRQLTAWLDGVREDLESLQEALRVRYQLVETPNERFVCPIEALDTLDGVVEAGGDPEAIEGVRRVDGTLTFADPRVE